MRCPNGLFYNPVRTRHALSTFYIPIKLIRIPAATAEPITPATFGAMACMRRWFDGSYF